VRQVLFDVIGERIVGCRAIDLFAGSGAIGIEALSRGASEVCFVERSHAALRCLRQNLESLGLVERSRVVAAPVASGLRILRDSQAGPFAWIFADPPYGTKPEEWMLKLASGGPGDVLADDGMLVVEVSRRQRLADQVGRLLQVRLRRVGETCLAFFTWEGRSHEAQRDLPGNL
jgi:16S rRNA (guanine(966)-N(2))-methyltransferase RsmD